MLPFSRAVVAVVAVVACTLAVHGASSAAETPRFVVVPDRIEADADLTWRIALRVANPGSEALSLDSLACVVRDLGPGVTNDDPTTALPLTPLLRAVRTIAPHDSA